MFTKYKLYYTERNNAKNGVGIVADKYLKEKIVGLKRLGNRLLAIKLVLKGRYNTYH